MASETPVRRSPRTSNPPKPLYTPTFNGASAAAAGPPSANGDADEDLVTSPPKSKRGRPPRTPRTADPPKTPDIKIPFSGQALLAPCGESQPNRELQISISGQAFLNSSVMRLSTPPAGSVDVKICFSAQAFLSEDVLRRALQGLESSPGGGDAKFPFSGQALLENAETDDLAPSSDSNFGSITPSDKLPAKKQTPSSRSVKSYKPVAPRSPRKPEEINGATFFVGDPVPEDEAKQRWPHHYAIKGQRTTTWNGTADDDDEDEIILDVKCHYLQANVAGCKFSIGDCAYVKGEEGKTNFVGRILEFFETLNGENYCTVQWFFRAEDTIMEDQAACHDKKRLFYSDLKNDNFLDCIVSKVRVVQVPPTVDMKSKSIPSCYYYYDMKYSVEYSSFCTMELSDSEGKSDVSTSDCSGIEYSSSGSKRKRFNKEVHNNCQPKKAELALLDLYSGCGGMSTGLCLGAQAASVDLIARWAVDFSEAACQSLKLNHPETQVRNETADDFFELLKEWEKLCKKHIVKIGRKRDFGSNGAYTNESETDIQDNTRIPSGEYEVLKIVGICYGDPTDIGKRGLRFKVRWKGYSPSDDTWEPIEALSNCEERIQEFVREGFKSKMLPLPGDVDVVCGGPPCQGISGINRFRNFDAPLEDERNRQVVVFMDIVNFLKPKYVLMENVVDILRFAKGTLARYALSRLVSMNYQARLGIMAAGCYGLPQFRLRVFLWGCHPSEKLPQFPLPTHEVILKYGPPVAFERNVVAYSEGQKRMLEKELLLADVLSDFPAVTNKEVREQMPYEKGPQTEFQRYIRTPRFANNDAKVTKPMLYDHRPLQLGEDDYSRVCRIPKRKGANFRDLPGVIVDANNTVQFDPTMERVLLPSGKPLVPDYAMNFVSGKSLRPFARLWWDETVPTVLTVPDSHSQAILHPEQDRVLTIRECARLQGFPDHYKFCGTIKDRYRQIGNAVAVQVSRALGYAMGLALLKQSGEDPVMTLPPKFSLSHPTHLFSSSSQVEE